MKKIIIFAAVFAVLGNSGLAMAQNVGGQKSKFIRPIGIQAVNDAAGATINFGVLVPNGSGGSIHVNHDNYPSGYGTAGGGGAIMLTHDAPAAHAADFKVTGEPNFEYEVTTSNPMTLTLSDGSASMQLSWAGAWVLVGGTGGAGVIGQNSGPASFDNWLSVLDGNGNGSFSQGAQLMVGAHQPPGLYKATWFENVNYQ